MATTLILRRRIKSAQNISKTTRAMQMIASFPFGHTLPTYDMVFPIARIIDEHFLESKVDKVVILTTKLENVFVQKPISVPYLPVVSLTINDSQPTTNEFALFEPDLES